MPTLLLIRHGENEYTVQRRMAGRIPGIHLNDGGRAQAQALADCLSAIPIQAIYSSPLERAMETIQPLAGRLSLPIQECEGLLETDVGDWQGKKVEELQQEPYWEVVQKTPSRVHFPGGESHAAMLTRLIEGIEEICARHEQNDLIALCFHADPIKMVIGHYINLPLDDFKRLVIDTGSVSVLELHKGDARLLGLNLKPPFTLNLKES
jgi:probable phosphomutase (TIGR03848 family)